MAVLEVKNLTVHYYTPEGLVKALDNVSLEIKRKGEVLGLVGESGSGKSTLGYAIAGLLPDNAEIVSGKIIVNGVNILDPKEAHKAHISVIFQDALTALNPVLTIGEQIAEIYMYNHGYMKKRAYEETVKVLKQVGLPENFVNRYPHELSGGQRQRVVIAMALSMNPDLIIADEPTTALDVTVQAKILKLLLKIVKENNLTMLYITHDLSLVAHMCDTVAVMYAGEVVEYASVKELFKTPLHPYTKALLKAIPRIDADVDELEHIEGSPPSLINPPLGCKFHPRCPKATGRCRIVKPKLIPLEENRLVRCFLYE